MVSCMDTPRYLYERTRQQYWASFIHIELEEIIYQNEGDSNDKITSQLVHLRLEPCLLIFLPHYLKL